MHRIRKLSELMNSKIVSFTEELAVSSAILCTCYLTLAWISFALGLTISPYHFWIYSLLGIMIVVARGVTTGKWSSCAVAGLCAFASVIICILVSSGVLDSSWDGIAYHQVSIISFVKGWNPVYAPHVVSWWNSTFPEKAWLGDTVANAGTWTDHYPKASWVLGALASQAFDSLNASKWVQPFFCLLAIITLYRSFVLLSLPSYYALVTAAIAALSPIAIVQLGTNYVDGLLGSVLFIQIGAAISWYYKRLSTDLFILIFGCIIGTNLKFTGAVYSASLLFVVVAAAFIFTERLIKSEVILLICGAMLVLITSFQTYLYNLILDGNAFYPLNVVDVMKGQISDAFLSLGRFSKFLHSTFLQTPGNIADLQKYHLTFPRLWHYKSISSSPDVRMAGFGSLFGWSLLLSFLTLGYGIFAALKLKVFDQRHTILICLMAWTLATTLINPEFWWARYVPQLWAFPILASCFIFIAGDRALSMVTASPGALGVALILTFWLPETLRSQENLNIEINNFRSTKSFSLLEGFKENQGVFTFAYQAEKMGARVSYTKFPNGCNVEVNLIKLCNE